MILFISCQKHDETIKNENYQLALQSFSERDFPQTIARLEALVESSDSNQARLLLQKSYYYEGKYAQAISTGKAIMDSEPNNLSALIFTSLSHIQSGEPQDLKASENYLNLALQIDPDNLDAWCTRGLLYEKKGDTAQAIASYSAAIHKGGSLTQAHMRLGILYKNFNMPEKSKMHLGVAGLLASGNLISDNEAKSMVTPGKPASASQ